MMPKLRDFSLICFITSTLLLPSCRVGPGGGHKNLAGNYQLFKANSYQISIVNSRGRLVILPTITGIAYVNDLIIGEKVSPRDPQFDLGGKNGYFIIDTKTDKIVDGLTYDKLKAKLAKRSIHEVPKLGQPTLL